MNNSNPLKTIKTTDGEEHKVAFEMKVRNRKFIITIDRKVLEDQNGSILECNRDDKDAKIFFEVLEPTKSLDIEYGRKRLIITKERLVLL